MNYNKNKIVIMLDEFLIIGSNFMIKLSTVAMTIPKIEENVFAYMYIIY